MDTSTLKKKSASGNIIVAFEIDESHATASQINRFWNYFFGENENQSKALKVDESMRVVALGEPTVKQPRESAWACTHKNSNLFHAFQCGLKISN